MILMWLIIVLLAGGVLAWLAGRRSAVGSRWVALVALLVDLGLAGSVLYRLPAALALPVNGDIGLASFDRPWIAPLGIRFHLAVDGFSLILVLLTILLGLVALLAAWDTVRERPGFFHLNLLWVLAGTLGVFMALDLFLFYFFWELMLVPMYFIIAVWGDEVGRHQAAVKFFIFTQLSGLLMLLAILALYFVNGRHSGIFTFDYRQLLGTPLAPAAGMTIMLGFFIAFAVKLPVFLVHTWLPDAYTRAPAPGLVILAGIMSKTGAYGLLRFVLPLFPGPAAAFAPYGMSLGLAAILYGAIMAFAQRDLKRLIAYSSLSHMGFVMLGVFAWNQLALQGVVMVILSHAVSISALFLLAGAVEARTGVRDLGRLGGLWSTIPRTSGALLLFCMAALGLPGLGNFVGEFLVLIGSYRVSVPIAAIAALGLVTSVIYAIWIVQRVVHGPKAEERHLTDLGVRETALAGILAVTIIWLGVYPQPVFKVTAAAMQVVQEGADLRSAAGKTNGASAAHAGTMSHAVEAAGWFPRGGRP